jgi:hypothetical protein
MQIGGWLIKERFFCQMEIGYKLWTFAKENPKRERQVQLFFIGWYDRPDTVKMWTIVVLGFAIQIQIVI